MTTKNEPLPSSEIRPLKERPYAVEFTEPSKARQEFKETSNVNNVVAQFEKTGFWYDPLKPPTRRPMTGDFTNVGTFQEAMNVVAQGRQWFEGLPASVRDRFANDPALLLDFLDNPENRAEAEKLGLLEPKVLAPQGEPDGNKVSETNTPESVSDAG